MTTTTASEVAALRATVLSYIETANKASDRAENDRAHMIKDIGDLKDGQTELRNGQKQLAADMSEVKPVTDMVTSLRARLVGAGIVLGIIGAVTWAGLQFFKETIIGLLGG